MLEGRAMVTFNSKDSISPSYCQANFPTISEVEGQLSVKKIDCTMVQSRLHGLARFACCTTVL